VFWASRRACFAGTPSGYPLHHLHGFASLAVSVVPLLSLSRGRLTPAFCALRSAIFSLQKQFVIKKTPLAKVVFFIFMLLRY
jgi:hypothetical protein